MGRSVITLFFVVVIAMVVGVAAYAILVAQVQPPAQSSKEIGTSSRNNAHASTTDAPGSPVGSWSEYVNTHAFSFRYPEQITITSTDDLGTAPPPPPGVADDSRYVYAANLASAAHELEVTVNDSNGEDAYGDPPSFWRRDLKTIADDAYSRIKKDDGAAVQAPFEKDLNGEPAYWILVRAVRNAQGLPQALVGWNQLGQVSDEDTFIVLTSHKFWTYEIIVPNDGLFMQIIGTWHFASSTLT